MGPGVPGIRDSHAWITELWSVSGETVGIPEVLNLGEEGTAPGL